VHSADWANLPPHNPWLQAPINISPESSALLLSENKTSPIICHPVLTGLETVWSVYFCPCANMDYAQLACSPMYQYSGTHCSNTLCDNTQTSRRAHPALARAVLARTRGRGCQQLRLVRIEHGVQGDFGPKRRLWLASTSRVQALKAGRIGRRSDAQACGFACPRLGDVPGTGRWVGQGTRPATA
jgi:hypothetical protein